MLRRLVVMLLVLASLAGTAMAAEVEFNYNGRVRVRGHDFDGPGLFKFALTSQNGQHVFWANDGVTLNGNQPTTSVSADVIEGFFSVNIGDTDLAGMAPLNPAIFNTADRRVRLRVWFSDGTHGFQRLLPDALVLNPALLGLQSGGALELYVDAENGNDSWAGVNANRAKKSIQAAWNALPKLIDEDATIHVASGAYYETLSLNGKSALGSAKIRIEGDVETPASVVVSGAADAATSETAVVPNLIDINEQTGLELRGLTIRRATSHLILANNRSTVQITSCVLERSNYTAYFMKSDVNLTGCEIRLSQAGVFYNIHSTGEILNTHVHDLLGAQSDGFACWSGSHIRLAGNNLIEDCDSGIHTQFNSVVSFAGPGGNVIRNCDKGLDVRMLCTVFGSTPQYGYVSYSGNRVNVNLQPDCRTDQ